MRVERFEFDAKRKVTFTAYLQDVKDEFHFEKRPGMLVIPGGAYQHISRREQDSVAFAYLRAGYQVFLLSYGVKEACEWPSPLNDYEEAMALIEEKEEEFGVDLSRIAIVGFSAGGHLAACAATMAEHKPAAAVLVYPVILEDVAAVCTDHLPNPCDYVDEHTCPCFLVASRDDKTVNVRNTLQFELALERHQVPFESHIYSYGHHGFASAEKWINEYPCSERLRNWMDESVGWLNEVLGELTYYGFTERQEEIFKTEDSKPYYSANCSVSYLFEKEELNEVLSPVREAILNGAKAANKNLGLLVSAFRNNTLFEVMKMMRIEEETAKSIDAALRAIPKKI
ncbi:MAG: alpha/beta hydrolase [Erysipelotrichaceae bacterium]|nr:alpha/beta hydrolase [Erysipelotrichaceae bacterium]